MDYRVILKNKRLRLTPARLAILGLLAKIGAPLQAEEIWRKTNEKFDQATIYRTVKTLTEEGILKQVDFKQGRAHYEIKDENNHHHHLVCLNCSKVVDIENCNIVKLEKNTLKNLGFKSIKEHSLEFFGICNSCS